MRLDGDRRVFSVEDVTGRLATMFEGLRSFWVEAEIAGPAAGGLPGALHAARRARHRRVDERRALRAPRRTARPTATSSRPTGAWSSGVPRGQVSMRGGAAGAVGRGPAARARRGAAGAPRRRGPARRRSASAPCRCCRGASGLVTSADGAARDDVLTTLWARFPADVVLVGVPVQGDAAPGLIARAIAHLDAMPDVDVIVVARGGGSLEDLMAFNSEMVCRAVAAAATPIVSAVGHERDVTLCDLVADVRVATPTAVAEVVVPSAAALEHASRRRGAWRSAAGWAAPAPRRRRPSAAAPAPWRARCGRPRRSGATGWSASRPRLGAAARAAPRPARPSGWTSARPPSAGDGGPARRGRAPASARAEGLLALLSPRRTVARGYAIVRDAGGGARDRLGRGRRGGSRARASSCATARWPRPPRRRRWQR